TPQRNSVQKNNAQLSELVLPFNRKYQCFTVAGKPLLHIDCA
ncbi:MAG: hypothetical protein ACI9Y1_003197, partial [Lentisphaeria bacterium]